MFLYLKIKIIHYWFIKYLINIFRLIRDDDLCDPIIDSKESPTGVFSDLK